MLVDTKRGNGCLGEDGDDTTRWLCTKRGQIREDALPNWIQQMHQSKKMVDLNKLSVGVSRGYTDYHQGRAIHMADSRID